MAFNLPVLKPVRVEKKVDSGSNVTDDYKDQTYTFQLYKENGEGGYEPYGDQFTLTNGGSKVFPKLDQNAHYYVKEIGVDSSVYSEVKINNDDPQILNPDSGIYDIESQHLKLEENGVFTFNNKIREDRIGLHVNKQWVDNNVDHSKDMIRFNIIRTDENGNETTIVYNKKKTFALKAGNNWEMDFSDLPVRYGSHTYTYRVKELDVPMGYAVEYNNTLINKQQTSLIKNKTTNNVEINVEKEWLDNDGTELKNTSGFNIEVELHRKWEEYDAPNPTTLTIRAVDTKGRTLKEWYTNKAYVGGSIEYSVTPPLYYEEDDVNGTYYKLKNETYTTVAPTTETMSQYDGITKYAALFDVTFIGFDDAKTTGCSVIDSDGVCSVDISAANPVITMVYQEKEAPLYMILQHSFTGNSNGWEKRYGGTTGYTTSGSNTYALNDALLVTNTDGIRYVLPTNTFVPGKSYSFSLYVSADNNTNWQGDNVNNKAKENRRLVLAMNYTDSNEEPHWDWLDNKEVPLDSNGWVHLYNDNYPIPADAKNINIYVESSPVSGDKLQRFRIDEFVAAKGGVHIDVIEGTGEVVLTGEAIVEPIQRYDFNSYTSGIPSPWQRMGSENKPTFSPYTESDSFNGTSVHIDERGDKWHGMQLPLTMADYAPWFKA
ncbi:MAG TPA: Cna B-type domain-containing protein [Ruminococcus flavefaciens]|nr:Cna B-type domain-containing protein [Ruminococcus flavefaciens]